MFLIVSRVRNLCSNHRINVTAEMKLKISNRTVAIENITIQPGGHMDIRALDTCFSSIITYPESHDVAYHCKFVPISSHDRQGQTRPTKTFDITGDDAIACAEIDFVDENDELKVVRIEGNRLARIWTIWEVRDLGLKLMTYGERIASFVENFFLELQPDDEEHKDELRQPLIDPLIDPMTLLFQ